MWVRSRYANELAVLCAWIAILIPWNVAYLRRSWEEFGLDISSSIYIVRFPFFELQVRSETVTRDVNGVPVEFDISNFEGQTYPGVELVGSFYLTTPVEATGFYDGTLELASIVWLLAAVAFALAFALSIALYFRETIVSERLPVDQVRLMGVLLGIGAIGTGLATVLYGMERDTVGIPLPIGVLIVGALALVLLRTEQLPDEPPEQTGDSEEVDDGEQETSEVERGEDEADRPDESTNVNE